MPQRPNQSTDQVTRISNASDSTEYRSINGTGNNVDNYAWGSSNTAFYRDNMPAQFPGGVLEMDTVSIMTYSV